MSENLEASLWNEGEKKKAIELNPEAALQQAIFRDGFVPTSAEFSLNLESNQYVAQMAEHLGTGEKRVYYAQSPDWRDIRFITSMASDPALAFSTPSAEEAEKAAGATPSAISPSGELSFSFWPTTVKKVNQYFGKNPELYEQFGLPGHEGVDLASPFDTAYFAAAPGKVIKVSDKRFNGEPSAYGWHVVVDHGNGYTTLYAHAKADPPVAAGQQVAAGQVLAFSGNTGNSSGAHLHLTLKKSGYQIDGWPKEYMDPWPFLKQMYEHQDPPVGNLTEGYLWSKSMELLKGGLAKSKLNLNMRAEPDGNSHRIGIVKAGSTIRLLDEEKQNGYYFCEASVPGDSGAKENQIDLIDYLAGTGRIYEVRDAEGEREHFQTQLDGTRFYQTMNENWIGFFFDNDFIYRDVDTTPGGGLYSRMRDPDLEKGSRWVRRRMVIGQSYQQPRSSQLYQDTDGLPEAGAVTTLDIIRLVNKHQSFNTRAGFQLEDVIEIQWVNRGETFFYARGYGLVAWELTEQDPVKPQWKAMRREPTTRNWRDNRRVAIKISS